MKKFFLLVLALSVGVLAAEGSLDEQVKGLQAQVDRVMAKSGIHFSGEFRSQFLNSSIDGDAVGNGKRNESVEYTSVDFDITARPNSSLSARAMFRLHQDWRNFFSDVQNPISTRWLSIDGNVQHGIYKFNIGDYHKKMSPLTVWSPDLEFLYEPDIFKENRMLAMSEMFVGNNNRALQGANFEFRAELGRADDLVIPAIEADVFGARLAARGTGESGVIAPGVATEPNGEYWDNDYDRYLVGVNLGTQIFDGFGLGVSSILIFDYANSFDGDSTAARLNAGFTNVVAPRINFDSRLFMPDDMVKIGLKAEMALSSDREPYLNEDGLVFTDSSVNGMALNAGLTAQIKFDSENNLNIAADIIMNNEDFRNDAAQSPTFIQKAIMNSENNIGGLGLLNPFDALYRSVFKYSPSQYFGGPKPQTKNSYVNSILTPEQVGQVAGNGAFKYPSVFQTAMPGGMATADRVGPVFKLDGSFLDKGFTVGVKGAQLNTMSETRNFIWDWVYEDDGTIAVNPETGELIEEIVRIDTLKGNFTEFVGGASVDFAKFAPNIGPSLVLSGSYGMYNSKYGDMMLSESGLLSIGLNYQFHERFSVLFGYQQLGTVETVESVEIGRYTFDNTAFGLGYRVADGGKLTAKFSMLTGKREWDEQNAEEVWEKKENKYRAFQPEVYLTVKF
jgi:hypothetical protein